MLGSLERTGGGWQWGAAGKHPTARDYFDIGGAGPILKAFADWIEKGYQLVVSQKNVSPQSCSWRFWVKSGAKDSLVCGLVKQSCDSVGRPYPLLIMGAGVLKEWINHWELLILAFEQTWSHMEFISARRFADFGELEEEVKTIRAPFGDWPMLAIAGQKAVHSDNDIGVLEKKALEEMGKDSFWIPLDRSESYDPKEDASALLRFLRTHMDTPNAVFMGGSVHSGYVAVFRRALSAEDFVRLWTFNEHDSCLRRNG